MLQDSKSQIVTKLKNLDCDKTKKTWIVTKLRKIICEQLDTLIIDEMYSGHRFAILQFLKTLSVNLRKWCVTSLVNSFLILPFLETDESILSLFSKDFLWKTYC